MGKYLLSKERGANAKNWLGYSIRPIQITVLLQRRDYQDYCFYTRAEVRDTQVLWGSAALYKEHKAQTKHLRNMEFVHLAYLEAYRR